MIETERLEIVPLQYAQLLMYVKGDPALEKELGLQPVTRSFSPELVQALEHAILPNMANPKKNYLYITLWAIILKSTRITVGDLCFKGEPDEKGEIEIGYGTYDPYRKNGYMTEAVAGIINWAKKQKQIKAITGETRFTNPGSLKILLNNHFQIYKQKGDLLWLRLVLRSKKSVITTV